MIKRFYAPTYLEEVYSSNVQQVEDAIIENYGSNGWDMFTALKDAGEVEEFLLELL